ncbi:unnamed protein product [Hyaloperonospora brassicae]|uniref:Glucosamine/galactosamine-6-phosphate isomerase domain-containing protein n=1 Tax=Hyaloperonospora brassicae TaxID=162125 RepID=A0AAV0UU35_HYABA|nr:unnamed protein product [Hyaloperonospora brassicae]
MGPSGHMCSLFPGHPLLEEKTLFVASTKDSTKPPSQRITLTYPVINNVANISFVDTDTSKAELILNMIGVEKQLALPAANIKHTCRSFCHRGFIVKVDEETYKVCYDMSKDSFTVTGRYKLTVTRTNNFNITPRTADLTCDIVVVQPFPVIEGVGKALLTLTY